MPIARRCKQCSNALLRSATRLVSELFPAYVSGLERARTSYRPVEITGRSYSPLKDDKLLHVDAFPSTPTQGRRILRLFTNIAPAGQARIWRVGEPFQDFARKFLPNLPRPNPLSAWFFAAVGATKSRRSPYDQLMLCPARWSQARRRLPEGRAPGRDRFSARNDLALLHRPGLARRARRTVCARANLPSRPRFHGGCGALSAQGARRIVRTTVGELKGLREGWALAARSASPSAICLKSVPDLRANQDRVLHQRRGQP